MSHVENSMDCQVGRRVGLILGVSAEISQNSDTPSLDGVANLFLNLVEQGKPGINSSILPG